MAVDEALMVSAAEKNLVTLRLYRWEVPTLSLGYFQKSAARSDHHASHDCPLIRRASGGGAIIHDHELTYSLAVPTEQRLSRDHFDLYLKMHEVVIEALRPWGIEASLCRNPPRLKRDDEPFLCFQRRSEGDVLVGGDKICGSAQRRGDGALLQHGSLLLKRSDSAPELEGIEDLGRNCVQTRLLVESLIQGVSTSFGISFRRQSLANDEIATANRLKEGRFATKKWNYRR